jgi:hypothetical protein
MQLLPNPLPRHPSDRTLQRLWSDSGWRQQPDGRWIPTEAGTLTYERVAVQETEGPQAPWEWPATWIVLLDGAILNEADGTPMTFPDQYSAGCEALRGVRNDWHGPSWRFSSATSWTGRHGFWMRRIFRAFMSASGHCLSLSDEDDTTPVAVIQPWQWPGEGWGCFVGSEQRYCLQTTGRVSQFKSAEQALHAANHEVGHWLKTHLPRLERRKVRR